MSGGSVPYHLRPNKYVDREIFLELLGYVERYMPIRNHVYVGFGGPSLEDFRLMHYRFGTERMLSIEQEAHVLSRQDFNNPFGGIKCLHLNSGTLIDNLDVVLEEQGFSTSDQLIFWLDYTSPKERREQMQEFSTLLAGRRPGDIIKLTLNATPDTVYRQQGREDPETVREKRLTALRDSLDEYLPTTVTPDMMEYEKLPGALCLSLQKAAYDSLLGEGRYVFQLLTTFRYSDSASQMLTVTGIVLSADEVDTFLDRTGLHAWEFASKRWGETILIRVPELTLREKIAIERELPGARTDEILDKLAIQLDVRKDKSLQMVDQYCRYHRYYPHFHRVMF